jgi:hypothetical protein
VDLTAMKLTQLAATLSFVVLTATSSFADATIKNNAGGQTVAPGKSRTQPQKQPAKRPVTTNPCAQFGVGFTKLAGSDTCVKIGGSVRIEGGGSGRR